MESDFDRVMAGLGDALDYVENKADLKSFRIHVPEEVDVKAIRSQQGLSQNEFAVRYGFSPSAVRDWEQHRRRPEASARVLLRVIERRPDAVMEALNAA